VFLSRPTCVNHVPVTLPPRTGPGVPREETRRPHTHTPNAPSSHVSSTFVQSRGAEVTAFEGDYKREGRILSDAPRLAADPRVCNQTTAGLATGKSIHTFPIDNAERTLQKSTSPDS
jgi:hypothetical protein